MNTDELLVAICTKHRQLERYLFVPLHPGQHGQSLPLGQTSHTKLVEISGRVVMRHRIPVFFLLIERDEVPGTLDDWHSAMNLLGERLENRGE